MRRAALAIPLAFLALGCEPHPTGTAVAASSAPPGAAAAATTSKLRARPFTAAFGGWGPAVGPPQADVEAILLVDVETTAALSSVAVASIELLDGAGRVVARASPPITTRRDDGTESDDARRRDFSEYGTASFDGSAAPGARLRLYASAPLDTRLEALEKTSPVRFRARISAAADPGVDVEGPLEGELPTAGPAAAP